MKKFIISGITYLGSISKKKNKKTYSITNACQVDSDVTLSAFEHYFKGKNLNRLESFTMAGGNGVITIHDLTPNQEINRKICVLQMEQSKTEALSRLENIDFSRRLGK